MFYFCCDQNRRLAVSEHGTLNGIDYLEVLDGDAPGDSPPQRTLLLRFLKPLPQGTTELTAENVRIEGGERISPVGVEWAARAKLFDEVELPPEVEVSEKEHEYFASLPDEVLVVRTDSAGDFSTYRLRLVDLPSGAAFDPRLSAVDFSFKVECPSQFDCRPRRICPPEVRREPDINYLAKDYASFRQLILDRLAVLLPQWNERHVPDVGVTLVELLAFIGDYLSYQQDAVATEAYLETARRRVSVRRHARLVDYAMHNGCNARAWVRFRVADETTLPQGTQLLTRIAGLPAAIETGSREYETALDRGAVFFETMTEATLHPEHDQLHFYTWGDRECCLPRGATAATLEGELPNLKAGDVLVLVEVKDARTGQTEEADPMRRHTVRLTHVAVSEDPAGGRFLDPPNDDPLPVTQIQWSAEDALPFPLCVSATTDDGDYVDQLSVAWGNVVLADQGRTQRDVELGTVPEPHLRWPPASDSQDRCRQRLPEPVPARFRPVLPDRPLTYAVPLPGEPASAAALLRQAPAKALPQVLQLIGELDGITQDWFPRLDLLPSFDSDPHFVVEVEHDGQASLRFGDDHHGERPEPKTTFTADYRIGNGLAGNVGAKAIAHIVDLPGITQVENPLPAAGGQAQETVAQARRDAPEAFRTQQRAVTPADYAEVTERHPVVQQAAATFRWTGSWHTVFVTVDRLGGAAVDEPFERELRDHLERFRMAGYDLEVDGPQFVALEVDMFVCVDRDYLRSQVLRALLDVFHSGVLPDGRRGVFHPDNFSFGGTVYLSDFYATAQAVPGVVSVEITRFQRFGQDDPVPLAAGKIELGRLEIARLDNDPNFPERGVFRMTAGGGR